MPNKKENAEDFEVEVKSTRPITKNDIDITYYDSLKNKLNSKPTTVGEYWVKAVCKGSYVGETRLVRYDII